MQHPARTHVAQGRNPRHPIPGDHPVRIAPGRRALAALAIAIALSGAIPSTTRAAEGLYLSWNDCYQGAYTSNLDFACNTNSVEHELYVAFTMPQPADNVVAVEIVVDLQHSSAVLPEWWHLEPNGCRWAMNEFNITAAASFPDRSACVDMWQGAATPAIAEVAGYIPSLPKQAANQARIKVTASVLPDDARTVDDASMYYAARIILKSNRTVGSPSCAGCQGAACLVLNSILVGRLAGSPGGDYFLQTPGSGQANWALWQGGGGANCSAVPVRSRAWGQLKGLYR